MSEGAEPDGGKLDFCPSVPPGPAPALPHDSCGAPSRNHASRAREVASPSLQSAFRPVKPRIVDRAFLQYLNEASACIQHPTHQPSRSRIRGCRACTPGRLPRGGSASACARIAEVSRGLLAKLLVSSLAPAGGGAGAGDDCTVLGGELACIHAP